MPEFPDDFIQRLNQKEEKAFEQLFRSYFTGLMRYGQKIVHDPETAREIVQELFLSLWSRDRPFPEKGSLRSYLFTSVYNRCLNHLRHLQVREKHQEHLLPPPSDKPFEAYFPDPFLETKIVEAIESLPRQCQKVFRLSRYQHLKNREIAEHLGISTKAVEKQIGRALRILRESLKDYLPSIALMVFLVS